MATNRLTIKRDGEKILVTSNDANIKQVFFGWASFGTGLGIREYPEFYGRHTEGDGSYGPDNSMWLWTLDDQSVAKMIQNLTSDQPCNQPSSAEQKADAYVLRAFRALVDNAPIIELDEFMRAYISAALWITSDGSREGGGEPLDNNYGVDDIAPEALLKVKADCTAFQEEHGGLLAEAYSLYVPCEGYSGPSLAGHDLWLTSYGSGVGFLDRDLGDIGDKLASAARKFGERDIYVGDDGLIHGF